MTELLLALLVALLAVVALLTFGLWQRDRASRPSPTPPRSSHPSASETNGDLTSEIVDQVAEGIVVFDQVLLPMLANQSARRMLGVGGEGLPPRLTSEGILAVARRAVVEQGEVQEIVSIWPGRKKLRVRALGRRDGSAILLMQDVTEELRTQQMRQQFVANASHELKSPVASLEALAEAIRRAVRDDPPAAERFATRLISEADRLGHLAGDLLDLSKLEDPVNISATSVNLSTVTRQILEQGETTTIAKRMNVTAQIASEVWVRGDDQQLGLMIRNLFDNAVRYTPEGGSVWIDVFREGPDVILRIADNGMGIPLSAQTRVFERFYRVNKDRSRETGGTGLGLSIVKHVAELHGGHVSLRSELGEGSVFTARLPALASSDAPSMSPVEREGIDR